MNDVGAGKVAIRRAVALLLLVAVLFLTQGWSTINAEFGDSHDGRNAAVWAMGSESLRQDGPVVSRLGARSELGETYANHPPLIYVETVLAEMMGGPARAATRAPAWLGSLAAMVLLTVLLRDAGLRMVSAAAGVALVAVTPMFLVYGTMLDTPVTSLPFGLALLVAGQRVRLGRRVPPMVAFTVAFLAPLSGWQSLLVAAMVGCWATVHLLRRGESRDGALALAGGAAAGLVTLVAWLLWAFNGSIDGLVEQFLFRSGRSSVGVGLWDLFWLQLIDVHAMFGLAVVTVAGAGLILALRGYRARALAIATLAVTAPYPLLFPVGAVVHDYWNYWFLVPLAVGAAVGFDLVLSAAASPPIVEQLAPVAVGLIAVVAVTSLAAAPPPAKQAILAGFGAGVALAEGRSLPSEQRQAWFTGAVQEPMTWLALATGRPAMAVEGADLANLADDRPQDLIFVGRLACSGRGVTYALETVEEAATAPPDSLPCGDGR